MSMLPKFLELRRVSEKDAFCRALGNMKTINFISLAAKILHGILDISCKIGVSQEMYHRRPVNLGFDVIDFLSPQSVHGFGKPELISSVFFDGLEDAGGG